jgi:hypothetical protein
MAGRARNTDFRVSTDFFGHIKTHRLGRVLGNDGVVGLIRIWCLAATSYPDGIFKELTPEDIEAFADWRGESGLLVETLLQLKFLEHDAEGCIVIHDWREVNSWAANAEQRADEARFTRLAALNREKHAELQASGYIAGLLRLRLRLLETSGKCSAVKCCNHLHLTRR